MAEEATDSTATEARAEPARDWLSLARDAYSGSTQYFDSSIRRQIEQDIRQFNSEHAQGSKYLHESYRTRSRLFRPKTRATIRKNEAIAAEALFSTTDLISITAQDESDEIQRANAELWGNVLQHRLSKTIPWFLLAIGAYQESQAVGVVASRQTWEVNARKGIDRPAVHLIPPENLRFDPGAKWWDVVGTSPYVIELMPMYVKDVKARMTQLDDKTGATVWTQMADSQIRAAMQSYTDSTRQTREGQQRQDSQGQETTRINEFALAWVHRNIVEVDGEDVVFYTLGTHALLSEPVPLKTEVAHGQRDYVLGFCAIEAHKIYPGGVSRLTRDMQAEINDLANLRVDNVKFVLNKRYFVKRGKQVDVRSLTRNIPGSATMMEDPEMDVKVVETADVTSSGYQEQDRLNLDFDDVAGAFSSASVQSNRKLNETVGGMNILTSNANQVSAYQLKTYVETWVEPVLRQLLLLEQYYETDEVIFALAAKKADLVQKFGLDQMTDEILIQELTLTVGVGMGTTNPTEKANLLLSTLTTLRDVLADGSLEQRGLIVDEVVNEIFGKLGYSDGSRFFDMERSDLRIQFLENKIAELEQALAQKIPPTLLAAQVRKLEAEISALLPKSEGERAKAVKTGVEAAYSAVQAAQALAAVPELGPIADGVMMAAGGEDPDFISPDVVPAGLSARPLFNPRTAIESQQAGAAPTAGTGKQQGIETVRADG